MTTLPPPPDVQVKTAKGPSPLLIAGIVAALFFVLCCGCGGGFVLFGMASANQQLENDFEQIQRQLEEDARNQPAEPAGDDWEE